MDVDVEGDIADSALTSVAFMKKCESMRRLLGAVMEWMKSVDSVLDGQNYDPVEHIAHLSLLRSVQTWIMGGGSTGRRSTIVGRKKTVNISLLSTPD